MQLRYDQPKFKSSNSIGSALSRYLARFNHSQPVLTNYRITPLAQSDALLHYQKIEQLELALSEGKSNIGQLLELSKGLLPLEDLFAHRDDSIRSDHLLALYHFINASIELEQLDPVLPEENFQFALELMPTLVTSFGKNTQGGSLLLPPSGVTLTNRINQLTDHFNQELGQLETLVRTRHDLDMIYPYPKEIPPDHPSIEQLRESPLINLAEGRELITVTIQLSSITQQLATELEQAKLELSSVAAATLQKLVDTTAPYFEQIKEYYYLRQQRTYLYLLLEIKNKEGLNWPTLVAPPAMNEERVVIEQAALPTLQESKGSSYAPLTITLAAPITLLLGANMAGKSSVLHTLYFNLTLVQMGLPLPAKHFKTTYPTSLQLILNSSGTLSKGESAMAAELRLIGESMQEGGVILIDEIFSSTAPKVAATLISAIREEAHKKSIMVLATTHTPLQLHDKSDQLLVMSKGYAPIKISLDDWERIERQELTASLAVAAKNPSLSSSIKHRLAETLAQWQAEDSKSELDR
jgi:hypothetical protein